MKPTPNNHLKECIVRLMPPMGGLMPLTLKLAVVACQGACHGMLDNCIEYAANTGLAFGDHIDIASTMYDPGWRQKYL
jgi:hypothetical protein